MNPTKVLDFRVPRARGDILPLNRWTIKLESSPRVSVRESGATQIIFGGETNAYLVAGGTIGDFKTLALNSGSEILDGTDILVSSDLELRNINSVQLAILEFDAQRRRCGDLWFAANQTARLRVKDETKFVLLVIRVMAVKGSRLSINSVSAENVKRSDAVGFERVQYLDSVEFVDDNLPEEFRNKLQRVSALVDGLNSSFHQIESLTMARADRQESCANAISLSSGFKREMEALKRSHIFDAEFYSASAGVVFDDTDEAMHHYLMHGMHRLISCSPLIDCSILEPEARQHLKNSSISGFLKYLSRPHKQIRALSEFFNPRYLEVDGDTTTKHPGGCVGWFIEFSNSNTFLPTTSRAIRWSDFHEAVRLASLNRISDLKSEQRNIGRMSTSPVSPTKETELGNESQDGSARASFPSISVVLVADENFARVQRSLRSVLNQSYGSAELVIVSNSANPLYRGKLQELASKCPQARCVYEASNNRGRLWNRGVDESSGSYIAMIRSGYEWDNDHLEKLSLAANNNRAAFVFSQVRLSDGETEFVWGAPLESTELATRNSVDFSASLIARNLNESVAFRFDAERVGAWEHALVVRLAELGNGVFLNTPTVSFLKTTTVAEFEEKDADPLGKWTLLGENWLNWARADQRHAVAGRTSVVIPVYGQRSLTIAAVEAVLKTTYSSDIEIVLVDNGSSFEDYWKLSALFSGESRIKIVHLPYNFNFALGSNIGAIESSGEYIFFLNNDTEVQPGWLPPLIEKIQQEDVLGVQSLLLFPDDSIQSAGTAFVLENELPVPFLVNQPKETACDLADTKFDVITAAAMLVRRSDFIGLQGFDPAFINGMEDIDFCLRMHEEPKYFSVESSSCVYHHESKTPGRGAYITQNRRELLRRWKGNMPTPDLSMWNKRGLQIASIGTDGNMIPGPKLSLKLAEGKSSVHWGLKFAAPGGAGGDTWGDTYFVESLRDSLNRQGVTARTYRHGPNTSYLDSLDHVNLVIRGLDRVGPIPGQVNVLWLISHPEAVTADELAGFDIVYVASEIWASEIESKYGIRAHVLAQATDISRFNTDVTPDQKHRNAVFVGSVHTGRRRSIVEDALAAHIPFSVIGKGWKSQLPNEILEGEHVPNELLASVYRSADVVLAEHWPLMGQLGFVQNRLFDAVASGCRVVSDPVPGIEELFEGAVQTYTTLEELRFLLSEEGRSRFPDDARLEKIARRIQAEHSFDARASRMIKDVNEFVKS